MRQYPCGLVANREWHEAWQARRHEAGTGCAAWVAAWHGMGRKAGQAGRQAGRQVPVAEALFLSNQKPPPPESGEAWHGMAGRLAWGGLGAGQNLRHAIKRLGTCLWARL